MVRNGGGSALNKEDSAERLRDYASYRRFLGSSLSIATTTIASR